MKGSNFVVLIKFIHHILFATTFIPYLKRTIDAYSSILYYNKYCMLCKYAVLNCIVQYNTEKGLIYRPTDKKKTNLCSVAFISSAKKKKSFRIFKSILPIFADDVTFLYNTAHQSGVLYIYSLFNDILQNTA